MTLPIAQIKNNAARRAAMCVAFPALVVWFYGVPLALLPFVVLARAAVTAWEDVVDMFDEMRAIWRRERRILAAAWREIWREPSA